MQQPSNSPPLFWELRLHLSLACLLPQLRAHALRPPRHHASAASSSRPRNVDHETLKRRQERKAGRQKQVSYGKTDDVASALERSVRVAGVLCTQSFEVFQTLPSLSACTAICA